MTKKIIGIFLTIFMFTSISSSAQVKIGATTAPNKFSVLELANIGKGLRLNQLTTSQRDVLTTKIEDSSNPDLAGGLLIYNKTSKSLEMWKDESEKWVMIPQPQTCTTVSSISIKSNSPMQLDEYGANDLSLEAVTSGNSKNADLYYEWYKNDVQIGYGKSYEVPKERLSFREAGTYKVRVFSCTSSVSAESKTSAPIIITINEN